MSTEEMQAILEQDDWLRRMARRLFHDPSVADDAAQDAWIAQLARQSPVTDSRSWLGGVLRNVRREERRAAARRSDHASDMRLRGDAFAPATDDLVADLQLRNHATRALLALEEPLRTTLYLRFVQDLPVTEVARRMDVAQSTTSERIARGLESLRSSLDQRHGGDRRAWLSALAPLALEARRPAGAGLASAQAVGWIAAAAAAAVGTTLVLRGLGAELRPDPATSIVAATPATTDSETNEPAASTALLSPPPSTRSDARSVASFVRPSTQAEAATNVQDATPKPPPQARLRAQVLLPDGKPASGARWMLTAVGGAAQLQGWTDLAGAVGEDGELDVSFQPPPRTFVSLTVTLDGYVRSGKQWNELRPSADETFGPLRLRPAGRLRGRLVDTKGDPILDRANRLQLMAPGRVRGVPLSFGPDHVIDPKTGRFELAGLPPGKAQLNYLAQDAGWVAGPLVEIVAGEALEVDIVWSDAEVAAAAARANEQVDVSKLKPLDPPTPKKDAEQGAPPKAKLAPVQLTLDLGNAVGPEDKVQAAIMGKKDLNATLLAGTGARLGPVSVDPGAAETLWLRGEGWLARVDKPALQAGGEQTLQLDLQLIERRVLVLRDGQPVRNREFSIQVLPMQFHMRPGAGFWKSDEEGRATLKLGRLPKGEGYRFTLQDMRNAAELRLFGTAEWAGSADDLTVTLKEPSEKR
ncbi:MAG: sigma factor-like helix-turn-helix DNA-binding protein [Planctomycetota bacterium]